jgi:hypothetical protein
MSLARGELEYAMSASSLPSPSSHRISILMSPAGRCLQCRDCSLSFDFPDGAQYRATAKQFESHSCGSSERRYVIVRYEGKVPVLASCAKCEHRFFTPSSTFERDPIGAEQYLANKFDLHRCEDPKRLGMGNRRGWASYRPGSFRF